MAKQSWKMSLGFELVPTQPDRGVSATCTGGSVGMQGEWASGV
jgi:hypothetical protein